MITREKFDFIKDKYGHYASWAIWSNLFNLILSNGYFTDTLLIMDIRVDDGNFGLLFL